MKNYIYILLAVLTTSCEQEVESFKLKEFTPEIVLNGVFNPDSILKVHVTQSIDALTGNHLESVPNINLDLYENGVFMGNLKQADPYFYFNEIYPNPENEYQVVARAPGFEKATCMVEMPSAVSFSAERKRIGDYWYVPQNYYSNHDTTIIEYLDTVYYQLMDMEITIHDNPNQENFYMFSIYRYKSKPIYQDTIIIDSLMVYENERIASKDKLFEMNSWGDEVVKVGLEDDFASGTYIYTSDNMFTKKDQQFYFQGIYFEPTKYKVVVTSLSRDYYNYLKTLTTYSNDPVDQYFAEKTAVLTNVTNGLGLVGGITPNVIELDYRDIE